MDLAAEADKLRGSVLVRVHVHAGQIMNASRAAAAPEARPVGSAREALVAGGWGCTIVISCAARWRGQQ